MFPLELSILVLALMAIILISYAIFLVKLKSSKEKDFHAKSYAKRGRSAEKQKRELPRRMQPKELQHPKTLETPKTLNPKSPFCYSEKGISQAVSMNLGT